MAFFQPLIVDMLPYPFNEEIKGIASVSGVPLGQGCYFKQIVCVLFMVMFHRIVKNDHRAGVSNLICKLAGV